VAPRSARLKEELDESCTAVLIDAGEDLFHFVLDDLG
jgi:hypothetical protein